MPFKFSIFGERFTRSTGALELMDDLGHAMATEDEVYMLGGGNPAKIPAVQAAFRRRLLDVAADERDFDRMFANYAHPRGEASFRTALADLLRDELGWRVSDDNIALTGGSQAAFFLLFNLFAGEYADGTVRRILLPLAPEYVGYADVATRAGLIVARRPAIESLVNNYFKYRLNIADIDVDESIGALCVSRPTNPTGNVLTDAEMTELEACCRARSIPLIVDNAYGAPFPNILFSEIEPRWNDGIIFCMSLSKLGLPGVRTGIVVAAEHIVEALSRMTAVMSLAVGSVGPVLLRPFLESRAIIDMSRRDIKPFYETRAQHAAGQLHRELRGLPYQIHKPEGAFFLWLWLPGLPITSAELYARLKSDQVYILSGHHFFAGLEDDWRHKHECLRISYARDRETVEHGIRVLAAEIRRAYSEPLPA